MKKGLTLIEMLIAMTITMVILAITITQFIMQRDHINIQQTQIKLDRETRLTLIFIGQELREIGLDPKRTHSFGITAGASNSLTYLVDRNLDGILNSDDYGNFYLNGDVLVFYNTQTATHVDEILSNVKKIQFRYYDDRGFEILAFPIPIDEESSPGFFDPLVAKIEVTLTTQIQDFRGRTMGHSTQISQCERKNR